MDLTQQRYSWLQLHILTIHVKNKKINQDVFQCGVTQSLTGKLSI